MGYEIAIINPRKKRRRTLKRASPAQLAWRKKFAAKYGKGRKPKKTRKVRRASKSTKSGVSAMAKRRRRRSASRSAKGRFVKKSRKSTARRTRRVRRARAKRTPVMGYTVGSRRIRRRKLNPRVRRRRYKRNPIGLPSLGGITNQLMQAGLGAAGGLALNFGLSFLPLPDMLKTGYARHATRIVGALGVGIVAKKFLGAKGSAVAAGALTIAVYDLLKTVITSVSPEVAARLGEFEDVSLDDADDLDYIDPASPIDGYISGGFADDSSAGDGSGDGVGGDLDGYISGDLDGDLDGESRFQDIMV